MTRRRNVQGIITRPSSKPFAVVLLFAITNVVGAKRFLQRWTPFAPPGDVPEPGGPAWYFFFSWEVLGQLLQSAPKLDPMQGPHEFEFVFTDPDQLPDRPAMRDQLGFQGPSAPSGWWDGAFTTERIHLALHGLFESEDQRDASLAELRQSAAECGLAELAIPSLPRKTLSGVHPADGRVHFGYRDGVSRFDVDWEDAGIPGGVDVREFLCGYPTVDYPTTPQKPGPWQDFAREGSYVGLTWMYQDVASFHRFLVDNEADAARVVPAEIAKEWLAAKLMGRWRDGSPLAKHPDRPPETPDLGNDFGYAEDPDGLRCPIHSHIRVTNCRDQALTFPNQVRFPKGPPRLIRRGFVYGPPLEGTIDDGVDRGLVGLFFCARLNEQLYTVLRWMQETEFGDVFFARPNGDRGQDAILGNRSKAHANTRMSIPNAGGELAPSLPAFVRFKGVAPLFAPSLSALRVLAA